jgi:hypothetical protein
VTAGPPSGTVQYRVVHGRADVAVDGPDDADLVVTCPAQDAGGDPTVAYMQGRLKAVGHTGVLFRVLASGEAAARLSRLASRP